MRGPRFCDECNYFGFRSPNFWLFRQRLHCLKRLLGFWLSRILSWSASCIQLCDRHEKYTFERARVLMEIAWRAFALFYIYFALGSWNSKFFHVKRLENLEKRYVQSVVNWLFNKSQLDDRFRSGAKRIIFEVRQSQRRTVIFPCMHFMNVVSAALILLWKSVKRQKANKTLHSCRCICTQDPAAQVPDQNRSGGEKMQPAVAKVKGSKCCSVCSIQ